MNGNILLIVLEFFYLFGGNLYNYVMKFLTQL
nr:MAG TPA: mannose-6-phosphate receptor [Caudoviricetes sp.]